LGISMVYIALILRVLAFRAVQTESDSE